jgi:hypothetical protein
LLLRRERACAEDEKPQYKHEPVFPRSHHSLFRCGLNGIQIWILTSKNAGQRCRAAEKGWLKKQSAVSAQPEHNITANER